MEGNIRLGKVFKANERGLDVEALLMNGDRGMSLCSGWTQSTMFFSLCHGKHVLCTWVGTTTFPNHIPLDCNTSPQPWQVGSVLGGLRWSSDWKDPLLHGQQAEAWPLCLFFLWAPGENTNQKQNQTCWIPKLVVSFCDSPPPLSLCESALSD